MKEYSFTEERQHFSSILDEAEREGIVCVRKKDGESFYIKTATSKKSPFDIKGIDLSITASDVVDAIREGREREYS